MTCFNCRGTGEIKKRFLWIFRWTAQCPTCNGYGSVAGPAYVPPSAPRRPTVSDELVPSLPTPRGAQPSRPSVSSTPARSSGDPLTAAVVASVTDGDPMVAAATTMLTGDTGLGILAGSLAGHHHDHGLTPGGGDSAAAGASGDYQPTSPPADLPVIAEPFRDASPAPMAEAVVAAAVVESSMQETTCAVPDAPTPSYSADPDPGFMGNSPSESSVSDSPGTQY